MWAFIFIVLGGEGVLASESPSVDCEKSVEDVCSFDMVLPQTKQDLTEFCPGWITNLECKKNYEDSCMGDDPQARQSQRYVDTAKAVCEEGSTLNQAIGEHIECLSYRFLNDYVFTCSDEFRNLRDLYTEHSGSTNYDFLKLMCLEEYSNVACSKRLYQKECGTDAAQASLEVLGRLRLFDQFCTREDVQDFKRVIPQLKLDEENKESLLEALNL